MRGERHHGTANRTFNGFIMAAGLGTRLKPFTDERPKPLFPAGRRTFLDRNALLLKSMGIARLAVNVHHLGDMITAHIEERDGWGLDVVVSEEPRILGTGGGARRAAELLGPAPLVIAAGDIAATLDPDALLAAHRSSGAPVTIALALRGDVARYGGVRIDDSNSVLDMAGILGREGGRPLVNASYHVIEEELLPRLPGPGGCLVRDFYLPLLREEVRVNAHVHEGFWGEGGTPGTLLDLNRELLELESAGGRGDNDIGALSVEAPSAVGEDVETGAGVRIGPHAVIGDGCRLGDGCSIRRSILLPGAIVRPGEALDSVVRSARHEWRRGRPQS
jgi:mannose-1-phosphate guanylyltransferase